MDKKFCYKKWRNRNEKDLIGSIIYSVLSNNTYS